MTGNKVTNNAGNNRNTSASPPPLNTATKKAAEIQEVISVEVNLSHNRTEQIVLHSESNPKLVSSCFAKMYGLDSDAEQILYKILQGKLKKQN